MSVDTLEEDGLAVYKYLGINDFNLSKAYVDPYYLSDLLSVEMGNLELIEIRGFGSPLEGLVNLEGVVYLFAAKAGPADRLSGRIVQIEAYFSRFIEGNFDVEGSVLIGIDKVGSSVDILDMVLRARI